APKPMRTRHSLTRRRVRTKNARIQIKALPSHLLLQFAWAHQRERWSNRCLRMPAIGRSAGRSVFHNPRRTGEVGRIEASSVYWTPSAVASWKWPYALDRHNSHAGASRSEHSTSDI